MVCNKLVKQSNELKTSKVDRDSYRYALCTANSSSTSIWPWDRNQCAGSKVIYQKTCKVFTIWSICIAEALCCTGRERATPSCWREAETTRAWVSLCTWFWLWPAMWFVHVDVILLFVAYHHQSLPLCYSLFPFAMASDICRLREMFKFIVMLVACVRSDFGGYEYDGIQCYEYNGMGHLAWRALCLDSQLCRT